MDSAAEGFFLLIMFFEVASRSREIRRDWKIYVIEI
jgi:hypothetical protein